MQVLQGAIRPLADLKKRYNEISEAKMKLLEILAEADVRKGRVAPMEDTFANLREILKENE